MRLTTQANTIKSPISFKLSNCHLFFLNEVCSERAKILQLAREEGRHASVFHAYTKQSLRPQKTMSVVLPLLYRLLGKRWLYRTIAKGEYDALLS